LVWIKKASRGSDAWGKLELVKARPHYEGDAKVWGQGLFFFFLLKDAETGDKTLRHPVSTTVALSGMLLKLGNHAVGSPKLRVTVGFVTKRSPRHS